MNVSCEKCGTSYDLEDARIGESGLTVKCTHCGHIFQVQGEDEDPFSDSPLASMEIETPKLGAWRVRRLSGEELSFDDFATLRQWIVERRVTRDDQISKTGDNWKPIGSIIELASLFDDAGPLIETPPREGVGGPPPPTRREDLLDVSDVRLAGLDAQSDIIASSMFDPLEIASAIGGPETHREEYSAAPAIIASEDEIRRPPPLPARGGRQRAASGPPPVVQAPPRRSTDRGPLPGRLPSPPHRPSGARIGARESVVGRPPPRASANRLPPHRDSVPNLRAVEGAVPRRRDSMPGPRRRPPPPGPRGPVTPGQRDAPPPAALGMNFEGEAPPAYVQHSADGGAGRGFLMGVLTMLALAGVGYFVYDNYVAPNRADQPPPPAVDTTQPKVEDSLARARQAYARDTEIGLGEAMKAYDDALGALGVPPSDPALAGQAHIGRARVALVRAEYALIDGDEPAARAQLSVADRALAVARTLGQDAATLQLTLADYHRLDGQIDLARNYIDQIRQKPEVAAELALVEAALGLHVGKAAEAADALGTLPAEAKALPRAAWLHAAALKLAGRPAEARGAAEALLARNPGHEAGRRLLASLPAAEATDAGAADGGSADGGAPQPDAAPAEPAKPKPKPEPAKPEPKPKPKPKPRAAAPSGSYDSLMDRGNALLENGKASQARPLFTAASKARPGSPEPWASLGWCELDARNYQAAIKHFDRALRQNSRYADGMYGQATAYERAGMTNQAKQAYQAYLNVHPRGSKAALIKRKLASMP